MEKKFRDFAGGIMNSTSKDFSSRQWLFFVPRDLSFWDFKYWTIGSCRTNAGKELRMESRSNINDWDDKRITVTR